MIRNGKLNMYLGPELARALEDLARAMGETPEGAVRQVILEAAERRRARGLTELARADAIDRARLLR